MSSRSSRLCPKTELFSLFSCLYRKKRVILQRNKYELMEEKNFKNRLEEAQWIGLQNGWEPLTEDEKVELDDLVKSFTNLG